MKELQDAFRKLDKLEKVYRQTPSVASKIAIKFAKDRFRAQNWIGDRTESWAPVKPNNTRAGRKGNIKRAIRETARGQNYVKIGVDHPGAQTFQEGAKIPLTPKSRKFFMAKYMELKQAGKEKQGRFYLNIATSKKKFLTVPSRPFLKESQYLARQFERQLQADINKALR